MVTAAVAMVLGYLLLICIGILRDLSNRLGCVERLQIKIAEKVMAAEGKLDEVIDMLKSANMASVINFYAIIDGQKIRIKDMKAMKIDQTIDCAVEFLDKKGNPAKVDGAPKWGVSEETLASIVASDDGMSAILTAVAPGSVKILLFADADLGEGVTQITGESEEIVISSLEATTVVLKLGEPVDLPDAPPVDQPPVDEPVPVDPSEPVKTAKAKKK